MKRGASWVVLALSMALAVGVRPPAVRAADLTDAVPLFEIPGLSIGIDTKSLTSGDVGLDFEALYELPLIGQREGIAGSDLKFSVSSKGYVALTGEDSDSVNSIISEARLSGALFGVDRRGPLLSYAKRNADTKVLLDEINRLGGFGGPPSPRREQVEKQLERLMRPPARFVTVDAHLTSEVDQGFDNDQWAVGAGLTTDLAVVTGTDVLARWLDAPFALLRPRGSGWVVQLPRFYVGYDYVSASEIPARQALTSEDAFSRLTAEVAWMTAILNGIRLRVSWRMYYEIDAPTGIKRAGKDFTSLVSVSAELPIGLTGGSLILKYVEGELPPTLEGGSDVSVGFRIEF